MNSDDRALLEQEEQRVGILRKLADDAYSWAACTFKEYVRAIRARSRRTMSTG
jgi:hypothetical protein